MAAEMAARASIPHISLVESIKLLMYMLIVIQSNKLLLALGSFNFDTASGWVYLFDLVLFFFNCCFS